METKLTWTIQTEPGKATRQVSQYRGYLFEIPQCWPYVVFARSVHAPRGLPSTRIGTAGTMEDAKARAEKWLSSVE